MFRIVFVFELFFPTSRQADLSMNFNKSVLSEWHFGSIELIIVTVSLKKTLEYLINALLRIRNFHKIVVQSLIFTKVSSTNNWPI